MTEAADTPGTETARHAWWAGPWPLALVFFAWCLFFYTRNYQHPYYYEKDAPTKVQQVMTGERNYFHPLLMLNATDAVIRLAHLPRTETNVSNMGHLVMAFFSAASVSVFVLLAFRCGGWLAAFATGVFLSLNEHLLTRAHYFKEDPALVFGLALSFLAMKIYHERPTPGRAAWLGAACAVAIGGKYVGLAALILAIPLVLMRPGARGARLGILLGVCVVTFLVIDWQWVVDFQAVRKGVNTQMHDLLGREEMVKKVPQIELTTKTYGSGLPRCMVIGLFVQIACLVHGACQRARGSAAGIWPRLGRWFRCAWCEWPVEWMLIVYPFIYTIVLIYTPRLFERHFLPVFACLWMSAALGYLHGLRWLWQRFPKLPASPAVAMIAVVAICVTQVQGAFFHRHRDLANDHRTQLAAWIRAHVPADAVIAQDRRVFLLQPDQETPRPELGLTQKVISAGWLSEFASLVELRKRGVTHLAMNKLDSGAFMEGGKYDRKRSKENSSDRDRPARRAFYADIEANSRRLWEIDDGDDGAMNPGLLFYELLPEK